MLYKIFEISLHLGAQWRKRFFIYSDFFNRFFVYFAFRHSRNIANLQNERRGFSGICISGNVFRANALLFYDRKAHGKNQRKDGKLYKKNGKRFA